MELFHSFVKDINVVGNKMARNGRKTAIQASCKFDAPPSTINSNSCWTIPTRIMEESCAVICLKKIEFLKNSDERFRLFSFKSFNLLYSQTWQ
jgi:hypothetical protein